MTAVILDSSILLVLGFGAMLILYLVLRHEFRAWLREQRQKEIALGEEVHEIRAKLQALSAKWEEPATAPEPLSTLRASSGINMTKRIQAIRLMRRGENSAHIAAALSMSRREVELLVRVHQMSVDRAAQAAGAC